MAVFGASCSLPQQVQKVAAAGQEMLQGVEEEGSAVAREVQKAVAESGEMLSSEASFQTSNV